MKKKRIRTRPHEDLGNRIRVLRGGRTQDEFARELGITRQALSLLEHGQNRPSPDVVGQLKRLGATDEQIFGEAPVEEVMERIHVAAMRKLPSEMRKDLRWLVGALASEKSPEGELMRKLFPPLMKQLIVAWHEWVAQNTVRHPAPPARPARPLAEKLSRRKAGLVPLVRIAAGMAIEALDATETGEYVTPPPWLEEEKIDAALRVVGDSMTEEGLRHDDIVFVRRKAWSSGGIAVARRRSTNEITLKQVFSRGADLELRSASERDIAPMRWPAEDSELHGVEIVGMWRPSWHSDDSHTH